jgi:3-methyladenine DNA glycosylase AlkD
MKASEARTKLREFASPAAATAAARFFKTGPGQYGEGDTFIGARAPPMRKLAREFRDLPLTEVEELLHSPIHEERGLALLILVVSVSQADDAKRKAVHDFYFDHVRQVNNWDLVDCSAPTIVGGYLRGRSRKPLLRLAQSASLWERRIAIVSTQHFIRLDEFADTVAISQRLLSDREDLIHKASGWMLREVGDRDVATLEGFLDEHGAAMPRTMLRYAIEHFPPERRQTYLAAGRPAKNKQGGR